MTTLSNLPPEIVQQIASSLPTVSSVIDLSLTCKTLHASISEDNYRTFRGWTLANFPSISFPPLWRDATKALTGRSRAWDRRAIVGRVLREGGDKSSEGVRRGGGLDPRVGGGLWSAQRQKIGYAPAIDSYEVWEEGGTWADRREVMAWGAGSKVVLRRRWNDKGKREGIEWSKSRRGAASMRTEFTAMEGPRGGTGTAYEDILDLRLLHPMQRANGEHDQMVIRRANHQLVKLRCDITANLYEEVEFDTRGKAVGSMDMSKGLDPFLATCDLDSVNLYHVHGEGYIIQAVSTKPRGQSLKGQTRGRVLKFLSDDRFAIAEQHLSGSGAAAIKIYQIGQDRFYTTSSTELGTFRLSSDTRGRLNANALAPLESSNFSSAGSGHVFLAGWSDGTVRLHDDRAPMSTTEYRDIGDDGQIAAVMPIGHESFIAGSHSNACMKFYDLRMPGARPYSYLDTRRIRPEGKPDHHPQPQPSIPKLPPRPANFNILLAIPWNARTRRYQPLSARNQHNRGHQQDRHPSRYGGSVYSLSMPSSASRTFFAGIENHVLQLDIASTDDIMRNNGTAVSHDWDLGINDSVLDGSLLDLSGYDRPPDTGSGTGGSVTTTARLDLRKQRWWNAVSEDGEEGGRMTERQGGWDGRWDPPYRKRGTFFA